MHARDNPMLRLSLPFALALLVGLPITASAQQDVWDLVEDGPQGTVGSHQTPGSVCHTVTFEGGTHGALVGTVPGTPITFDTYWRTVTRGGFANNPSGTAVAALFGSNTGGVSFSQPMSRVSLFYTSLVSVTLRAYDAANTVIATNTGAANFSGGFTVWSPLAVDVGSNLIVRVEVDGLSNRTGIDDFAPCFETDADNDGLSDALEATFGTDPNNPDTDGDGMLDGAEVDAAMGTGCPDPLDPDSDGDLLSDGAEVAGNTNPCNSDTDGDGLSDLIDPAPLTPDTSSGALEVATRLLADLIDALPLPLIDAPNNNAAEGRRNSMSSRVRNAANDIARGNNNAASALVTGVLEKIDGQGNDWMVGSPEKTALANSIVSLLVLLM